MLLFSGEGEKNPKSHSKKMKVITSRTETSLYDITFFDFQITVGGFSEAISLFLRHFVSKLLQPAHRNTKTTTDRYPLSKY